MLKLTPMKKWVEKNEDPLKIGDVVLMREENLSKSSWKLARIHELFKGKDNVIRSASLKVPSGHIVRRHLNNISLLEAHC